MKINYFNEDYDEETFVKTKHTKLKSLKSEEINKFKHNEKSRNKNLKNGLKTKNSIRNYDE